MINKKHIRYIVPIFAFAILLTQGSSADSIFVSKESDGTIRFSNRAPKKGGYKIFQGGRARFSRSRGIIYFNDSLKRHKFKGISKEVNEYITTYAKKFYISPELVKAVIHAESLFNPRAISRKGAMGMMQLMPETAKDYGVGDPFNARENIRGGVNYLANLLNKFKSERLALAAYNAGPANVTKYGGIPPFKETINYVSKVMSLKQAYKNSP